MALTVAAGLSNAYWQAGIDILTLAAAVGVTTAGTTCVQALVLMATERDNH